MYLKKYDRKIILTQDYNSDKIVGQLDLFEKPEPNKLAMVKLQSTGDMQYLSHQLNQSKQKPSMQDL